MMEKAAMVEASVVLATHNFHSSKKHKPLLSIHNLHSVKNNTESYDKHAEVKLDFNT